VATLEGARSSPDNDITNSHCIGATHFVGSRTRVVRGLGGWSCQWFNVVEYHLGSVHVVDSGSRLGCDLEPPVAPPCGSLVRVRLPCLNVLCEMLARAGVEPIMEDHHVRAVAPELVRAVVMRVGEHHRQALALGLLEVVRLLRVGLKSRSMCWSVCSSTCDDEELGGDNIGFGGQHEASASACSNASQWWKYAWAKMHTRRRASEEKWRWEVWVIGRLGEGKCAGCSRWHNIAVMKRVGGTKKQADEMARTSMAPSFPWATQRYSHSPTFISWQGVRVHSCCSVVTSSPAPTAWRAPFQRYT
jgi:hypothetical protein